jgi:phage tail-like protein
MSKRHPFAALHYQIEIGSDIKGIFTECAGLQIETEVYEFKEGGLNTHVHRLPGRAKVGNITLKRGVAPLSSGGQWNDDLWKWYCKILQGDVVRRNLSIILIDTNQRQPVARWNLQRAYIIKWVGPALKTGDSTVAIESIDLAHQGVELA